MIAVAAAVALLVGGGAGYGGALLAEPSRSTGPRPAGGVPIAPTPDAARRSVGHRAREPVPPAPTDVDTVAVAKRALPGTVMIQVGRATGSGFVLDTRAGS